MYQFAGGNLTWETLGHDGICKPCSGLVSIVGATDKVEHECHWIASRIRYLPLLRTYKKF